MIEGLRVPVIPIAKPSGVLTPVGPSMSVISRRDQIDYEQPPNTLMAE